MDVSVAAVEEPKFKEPPQTPDPLAKEWNRTIEGAIKENKTFHERIAHNRDLVAGFDWDNDPKSKEFYVQRANLILGAITTYRPALYARNPEISVVPKQANPPGELKLLCKTIQAVTNRLLLDANLKERAKQTLTAALTCSFGVVKAMYQSDIKQNPIIQDKKEDAQDNLNRVRSLMMELNDDRGRSDEEAREEELSQTLQALDENVEVPVAKGYVMDRVLTEHILVDPSITEFSDYPNAAWIAQLVPMRRKDAEAMFGYRLDGASKYKVEGQKEKKGARIFSGADNTSNEHDQVLIVEIWDKQSQRVYTMAKGCQFWLRAPYSPPKVGKRWYPFFLFPHMIIDGKFIPPSMVDLMEQLQNEHNETRDKYNRHRDLYTPGWICSADITEKSIRRFADSEMGEITVINTDGVPIQQAIMPRATIPFDPAAYDLSPIRSDIEQVTGLQDAMRSSVVTPKTATEARIQQQSLSGRVSELRDMIEDFCQQIAEYTAQIALMELSEEDVERIMGPHKRAMVDTGFKDMMGMPIMENRIVELSYDWPSLSRENIFDMVELQIRAGTTGEPNRIERQESWAQVLPTLQNFIMQIMQLQATGMDSSPIEELLKQTVELYDDSIEVSTLIPKRPAQPQLPPQSGGGIPAAGGGQAAALGAPGQQQQQQGQFVV